MSQSLDKLIQWSRKNYYDLPWRKNRSLYTTLVSEIMLQQTTVSTVLKHFNRFIKVFPDLESLANASVEEVCLQWQGLGYYRRARNLKKAADTLVSEYNAQFPLDSDLLQKIPGIGVYTANALLSIGADQKALAIDANLERVIARIFLLKDFKGLKLQRKIQTQFESGALKDFNSVHSYRDLNEALMDLGRVYCQARRADCHLCPMKRRCLSVKNKIDPLTIPVHVEKVKTQKHELDLARFIVRRGSKVLGHIKKESDWLSGQIEVPTFILRSTDKKLTQYPKLPINRVQKLVESGEFKGAITKYKIRNSVYELSKKQLLSLVDLKDDRLDLKYFDIEDKSLHFSSQSLRALEITHKA